MHRLAVCSHPFFLLLGKNDATPGRFTHGVSRNLSLYKRKEQGFKYESLNSIFKMTSREKKSKLC
jgi:hypothetical protein